MSKGSDYYGGFFWVAIISFIVPFFVGWKAFESAQPSVKPIPVPDVSGVDHNIWDYLLKTYVNDGLVDYDGIKKNYLFQDYVRTLAECDPEKLENDDQRLALLCNAYNAFMISAVNSHDIKESPTELEIDGEEVDIFGIKEHIYAGQTVSLNNIENDLVRPVFGDPRIHVALVCGAKSCPAIRREAYTGDRLQEQLQDQAQLFVDSGKYVILDKESGQLQLSSILEWYGSDWNEKYANGSYVEWINGLSKDPAIKQATQKVIDQIAQKVDAGQTLAAVVDGIKDDPSTYGVGFLEYNWALNAQGRKVAAKTSGPSSGGGPDE